MPAMHKHLLLTASAVLALFSFGCAAEEEPPPAKPAVVAGGTAAPQAYTARTKFAPPRVKGAFDCDDGGICWCVGDEACNEMFTDLPCGTFNSWCNQEMDKCFCDLDGGGYGDYN